MMKVHPRHRIRNLASAEIMKMFSEITHRYELTFGEAIDILGELIRNEAGYLKKEEDKNVQEDKRKVKCGECDHQGPYQKDGKWCYD